MEGLSFIQLYQPIAERLRTALDARPVGSNWTGRAGPRRARVSPPRFSVPYDPDGLTEAELPLDREP
ncbi:hypothetical protein ACWF9B_03230 [Streptomyces sp. NPDC055089]